MFKIFQVPKPKERLRETLPKPPAGMAWMQCPETREWKLIPEEDLPAELQPGVSEETVDFAQTNTMNTTSNVQRADPFANPFGIGVEETTPSRVVVTHLPTTFSGGEESKSNSEETDWELLSEGRNSGSMKSQNSHVFVSRRTSIGSTSVSIKRTPSSSTIDSTDLLTLGPTGKGILGVDYVEHVLLPTDTLQGICLAYKVSASRLKRANHFSGESLLLAPKKLVIPISKKALRQGYLRVQDTDNKEYKMYAIQAECPMLGVTEAKAYLELADWVLKDAIQSAREDNEWEKELPNKGELRAGEIRVVMNVESHPETGHLLNFSAQGAGYNHNMEEEKTNESASTSLKPVDPQSVNATAVKAEDIHSVSPTHNSFGVEMQSLSSSKESIATTVTKN